MKRKRGVGKRLEALIEKQLLELTPSSTLDRLYAAGLLRSSRKEARNDSVSSPEDAQPVARGIIAQVGGNMDDAMLLKGWNGKLIAEHFELPEMEVEIERAVEQVEAGLVAQLKAKEGEAKAAAPKSESQGKDE